MTGNFSVKMTLRNAANYFVCAIYDASAPDVVIESRQILPKPYGPSFQVTFLANLLAKHVYKMIVWESPDDQPAGEARNSHTINPSAYKTVIRDDEYMTVGTTEGLNDGETVYENTNWAGCVYSVERVGEGTMFPDGVTGVSVPTYARDEGGGFHLVEDGVTFHQDEKFVVRFVPQVVEAPQAGTPSAIFSSYEVINSDISLGSEHIGKALLLRASQNLHIVNLPPLSVVQNCEFVYIYTTSGFALSHSIRTAGSDIIEYANDPDNQDETEIILGRCEQLKLWKGEGKWQVDYCSPAVQLVGELLYSYDFNRLYTTKLDGQIRSRTQFARLWKFVESLDPSCLVTESVWTTTFETVQGRTYYTKKGFFTPGNGTSTFRVPLLYDMHLRAIDGSTRTPGSHEKDQIIKHTHATLHGGNTSDAPFGQTAVLFVKHRTYGGNFSNAPLDLTSFPYTAGGTSSEDLLSRVGNENTVVNLGAYALIRI